MASNFDTEPEWPSANSTIIEPSEQDLTTTDEVPPPQLGYPDAWAWKSWAGAEQPQDLAYTTAQQPPNMSFNPYLSQSAGTSQAEIATAQDYGLPVNLESAPYTQALPLSPDRMSIAETATIGGKDPSTPTEAKPRTQRERNRLAAHKCRQKSKLNAEELQKQERELAEQHRCLTQHVQYLKNEVLDLKNEVLRHGSCNSKLIGEYIAKAAQDLS